MIVDERTYNYLLDASGKVVLKYKVKNYKCCGNVIMPVFLEEHMDDILEMVPKTYRSRVKKLIDYMISKKEEVESFYNLYNVDVTKVMREYFEIRFGLKEGDPNEYLKKQDWMLKYSVINGRYIDKNGKGKWVYAVFPTEEELSKLEITDKAHKVWEILDYLYTKYHDVDEVNRIIYIGYDSYRLPFKKFIEALRMLGEDVLGLKLLRYEVRKHLSDEYIITEDFIIKPTDEEKKKMGLTDDSIVEIPIVITEHTYPNVDLINYKVVSKDVRFEKSLFKTVPLEKLSDTLDELRDEVVETLRRIRGIKEKLEELASKEGLKVKPYTPIEGLSTFLVEGENFEMMVNIKEKGVVTIVDEYYKFGRRAVDIEKIIDEIRMASGGLVSVYPLDKGLSIRFTEAGTDFESIYRKARMLSRIVEKHIQEYDKRITELKRKVGKIGEEEYVALFLVDTFVGGDLDTRKIIGRDKTVLYNMVARIWRRLDEESYDSAKIYKGKKGLVPSNAYTIIDVMVKKGYLKVTGDADVLINNNKRLSQIITKLGLDDTVTSFVTYKLITTTISPYTTYEKLAEKGLATPDIYRNIITYSSFPPPPEDLAREYNGKPIWHQLPSKIKDRYINLLTPIQVFNILKEPDTKQVFSDSIDKLVNKLTREDWSLATYYFAKYQSHLITSSNKVNIVKDKYDPPEFIAIKKDDYLVQVIDVKGSKKTFIVYDPNTKVGFPVKAGNVEQAVKKAEHLLDKYDFQRELKELRKLSKNLVISLWNRTNYDEYKVYSVFYNGKKGFRNLIVKPGILNVIKREIEGLNRTRRSAKNLEKNVH